MGRSRNIKPAFFKNELLAEMTCEVRLLFIGLWTLADREGRLEDRPKRIKAELFPFDAFDVDPMLDRLRDEGFLVRYTVDGVRFIHITNFVRHQDPHYREKASEIPPPPGIENQITACNVTRLQRERILNRDGRACRQCGATEHLCIDHVVPVSRGGTSDDENLQSLCLSCNTAKGNRLAGEEKNRTRPKAPSLPGPDEATSGQRRVDVVGNEVASVPLIPDSLNPQPDSLNPLPDAPDRSGRSGDARVAVTKQQVEEVYAAYPRKVAKHEALKAINVALRIVGYDELLAAVQEYAHCRQGKDPNLTPYPATWFNRRQWEDDRTEWKRAESPRGSPGAVPKGVEGRAVVETAVPPEDPQETHRKWLEERRRKGKPVDVPARLRVHAGDGG